MGTTATTAVPALEYGLRNRRYRAEIVQLPDRTSSLEAYLCDAAAGRDAVRDPLRAAGQIPLSGLVKGRNARQLRSAGWEIFRTRRENLCSISGAAAKRMCANLSDHHCPITT